MGKTHIHLSAGIGFWKHPHMHGEDLPATALQLSPLETPPHAWGRLTEPKLLAFLTGNTPTCMGKTFETAVTAR